MADELGDTIEMAGRYLAELVSSGDTHYAILECRSLGPLAMLVVPAMGRHLEEERYTRFQQSLLEYSAGHPMIRARRVAQRMAAGVTGGGQDPQSRS